MTDANYKKLRKGDFVTFLDLERVVIGEIVKVGKRCIIVSQKFARIHQNMLLNAYDEETSISVDDFNAVMLEKIDGKEKKNFLSTPHYPEAANVAPAPSAMGKLFTAYARAVVYVEKPFRAENMEDAAKKIQNMTAKDFVSSKSFDSADIVDWDEDIDVYSLVKQ
ncbi:Uncharacterised protein [uncultured archaeon]|nr:Uncharacterised protein [uncultured archaeon]